MELSSGVSAKGDTPDMLERHGGMEREGVRVRMEGVARPDPQPLRLLCLDTGRLLARELARDEVQELAGLTCSKKGK